MRPRDPPGRCATSLALALACTPQSPARLHDPQSRDDEVRVQHEPLAEADLTRLDAALAARTPLYWRLRTADGPRCEPWTPEPEPDDPHRGRLVHAADDARYSFTYRLTDGHLRLADPTRERDTPVDVAAPTPDASAAASTITLALTYPCVFTGMSLAPADDAAARQLILSSHERWFLDEATCTAAGPDEDPLPDAPGELHPLGCASALADPQARVRPDPRPPGPAAARLRATRRLFQLRARDGRPTCELWHHTADERPGEGHLERSARDERGAFTIRYDYGALGDTLTLLGPHELRRVRTPTGPADLTRTAGCLLARPLALRKDVLLVGADPWFLTRRACEAARTTTPPRPDPDCRPGHVPEASP